MKHSNGSIAKCRSHLQPGPWHSRACVPYKERLWESQVHADRVCVVCVCVCVRLIECICERRGSASQWVDKEREGKKVFWCLLRPYSHPWAVNRRAAAFQSQSQLPALTGQRLKTHRATLNMEAAEVHFSAGTFRVKNEGRWFPCDLLSAVAQRLMHIFIH